MVLRESLSISIAALAGHKLRTALTMLGIIFGVAAVIAMLSIGAGAKKETLDQIRLMGVNNVIIRSQPVVREKTERGRVVEAPGLTLDDVRALQLVNPLVSFSVPQRELADMSLRRGSRRITTTLVGTIPEYQNALHFFPASGGFFSYRDLREARRVAVLGSDAARDLFWFDPPVGGEIKIGEDWYTVIGIMEPKPRSVGKVGSGDRDLNRDVYVPLTTAMRRFAPKTDSEIDRIILTVKDEGRIREAATLAGRLLGLRHHAVDYRIVVPEELIRQSQKTQRIFNIVMGAIAGISLLVGGIGIMNIMLATVFERTREIGIRRAVGATKKEILGQFLIEAVILSVAGGLIGVALGIALTRAITLYAGWKTIVEFGAIILAFGVSAAVGVTFGIYPARKAAALDPIESLRYE